MALDALRQRAGAGQGSVSREEMRELLDLLDAQQRRLEALGKSQRALDDRLLAVENSRVFLALRAAGRLLRRFSSGTPDAGEYRRWIEQQEPAPEPPQLARQPLISVVLNARGAGPDRIAASLDSVLAQRYGNWELCVSGGPCDLPDARVRLVEQDGAARGEYIGQLEPGDTLSPFALEAVAAAIEEREYGLIYTDEDRIDASGRRAQPVFKPGWSPELAGDANYPGRFQVLSRKAREGGESAAPRAVKHIPRVLYHRRADSQHKAPGGPAAGKRAVSGAPLASIVICSRNAALLARCLKSIEHTTGYARREIVVVEHRTGDDAAMEALLGRAAVARVAYAGKFHYARMNNLGAGAARGEILVFLNDDVTPLDRDWLTALVAQAQRPEIGAVGARLLYPSGEVQHAGMAIGIMDGAGHPLRGTKGNPYWPWLDTARNVSAVTGACLAIRKNVFDQAGGFDPLFAVNYNDVDLCLRLTNAGYAILYEPAATLRHDECRTRMPGTSGAERDLFQERWADLLEQGDPYYHPALVRRREDAGLRLE